MQISSKRGCQERKGVFKRENTPKMGYEFYFWMIFLCGKINFNKKVTCVL